VGYCGFWFWIVFVCWIFIGFLRGFLWVVFEVDLVDYLRGFQIMNIFIYFYLFYNIYFYFYFDLFIYFDLF